MKTIVFGVPLGVVLLLLCANPIAGETIRSTAMLFRHGERTPIFEIGPLVNSAVADIGLGQLTRHGSRQMYKVGHFLRSRYVHLLPTDGFFRERNMKTLSSPPERCVMSLQSFMAGLMPPPVNDTNLPYVWQPFGMAVDNDGELIYFDTRFCPIYEELLMQLTVYPPADIQAWLEADAEVLKEVGEKVGFPLDDIMTMVLVTDIIRTNIDMNYDATPQWAVDAYQSTLEKYLARFLDMTHETELMLKIRGGPLITQMVWNMEAIAANRSDVGWNFLIYSSHDLTILNLARVLNVTEQIPALPSYADTIMVELVDNEEEDEDDGQLQVQTVYVDYANFHPHLYTLDVPGCGLRCSLSVFKSAVENYLVDSLADLCT